ncbi:hypothetical protein [Tritonibacter mobilis]|uniref:hypothetical protein n=1 Tax=Tritonibacter mobilis TaxID=379347 RepID=UPI003A5B944B
MTISLLPLWERGYRLNKSAYLFSPAAERDNYDRLHSIDYMSMANDAAKAALLVGKNAKDTGMAMTQAASDLAKARLDWRNRRQGVLLKWLQSAQLIAYGFEPPRRMDSQPVEIPATYWTGRVQWDECKLTVQGLEFIEIRIVTRQVRDEIQSRERNDLTTPQAAGRPTVGPAIKTAFTSLQEGGEIDTNASQQSHYPKVRRWLKENAPSLSVPAEDISDKTMQKHFSPLFNELRKSYKL